MNEEYHKYVALQQALRWKRKIERLRKEDIPFYVYS